MRLELLPLMLALALGPGCPGVRDAAVVAANAAADLEATAAGAISAACQGAYARARTADEIEAAGRVCKPALDAYDATQAARRALVVAVQTDADDATILAAQAHLAADQAALVAALGRLP